MTPLDTDTLIDKAYAAEFVEILRSYEKSRIEWSERCQPNVRSLLHIVDYIVRQRMLEHNERESHRHRGKKRTS